ncbi:MAG: ABC transporter permease subunit [Thermoguttaceae bacterium]|jgi:ABC-2 type transport system permease protein|nr:ABC transporter permease subunit [Thermoguttaceae bacterium]
MNRALLMKSILEGRLLLASCMTTMLVFCWTRVWLVGHFDMSRFETVIEQFREWERFSPVPFEHLVTHTGRIAMAYEEPILILCVCLWVIARGTDCISGEIGRGTMEMLLAQPVSRVQVLWSQASVTIAGLALLALASWLGLYLGIQTNTVEEQVTQTWTIPWLRIEIANPLAAKEVVRRPLADKVNPAHLVPAAFNLFSLGFFLAGLSTLMSSWDRYRWRTIGLVVGIYIVQLTLKIVGLASDQLAWFRRVSFFTAYEPTRFVSTAVYHPESTWSILLRDEAGRWTAPGPLGYNLILLGMGAAAYLAATIIFHRRDVPAPL